MKRISQPIYGQKPTEEKPDGVPRIIAMSSETTNQQLSPAESAQFHKAVWADAGRPLTHAEAERIEMALNALEGLLDDVDLTLYAEQCLIDARDFLSALIFQGGDRNA